MQAELIRFLKENLGKVETCYWHSQFINHSTANDILEHFCKSLEILENAKLRQVSIDGLKWFLKSRLGNKTYFERIIPVSSRYCSLKGKFYQCDWIENSAAAKQLMSIGDINC